MTAPRDPRRGIVAMPLLLAACILVGLFTALLAGEAWRWAAILALALPVVVLCGLFVRAVRRGS